MYSQSTRAHHDSYASSNAIPIGISDYYLHNREVPLTPDEATLDDVSSEEDTSPYQTHEATIGPVRQASIGKRSKPTLTTIRSSDNIRGDWNSKVHSPRSPNLGYSPSTESSDSPTLEDIQMASLAPAALDRDVGSGYRARPPPRLTAKSASSDVLNAELAKDAPLVGSLKKNRSQELLSAAREQIHGRSPLSQFDADDADDMSEKDVAYGIEEKMAFSENQGSLAQRVGARRPPRLNVDAVRDAEARGSLTSLPDLIRRATRLASNLDRGRTASRLGMDFFGDENRKSQISSDKRRSGNSLSDILNSFPPPGLATPGSRGSRANWPSHLRHSTLPSESDPGDGRRQRRCCGMPLWVFILVLLFLLILIAAAVLIPIFLVVIPGEHKSSTSSSALATCQKSLTCENGGANIIGSTGSCSCLCVNGYTGSTCTTKSSTGCTTTDIDGTSDVTVGSSIPRLIEGAQTNFSVSLNGTALLDLFSANNLSCSSENALVTFNGLSTRSVSVDSMVQVLQRDAPLSPTKVVRGRSATASASETAATSNGIIFDSTPTTSSSTSSASATSSSASSTSTSTSTSNSTTLDFARVAVLFVMQDSSDFEDGVTAQENLQDYFTSGTTSTGATISANNVTLATGYTANLEQYTITLSNGTSVGV